MVVLDHTLFTLGFLFVEGGGIFSCIISKSSSRLGWFFEDETAAAELGVCTFTDALKSTKEISAGAAVVLVLILLLEVCLGKASKFAKLC